MASLKRMTTRHRATFMPSLRGSGVRWRKRTAPLYFKDFPGRRRACLVKRAREAGPRGLAKSGGPARALAFCKAWLVGFNSPSRPPAASKVGRRVAVDVLFAKRRRAGAARPERRGAVVYRAAVLQVSAHSELQKSEFPHCVRNWTE